MTEYKHPLEMYFDGASREDGAGAGVVFVSPEPSSLTRTCSRWLSLTMRPNTKPSSSHRAGTRTRFANPVPIRLWRFPARHTTDPGNI